MSNVPSSEPSLPASTQSFLLSNQSSTSYTGLALLAPSLTAADAVPGIMPMPRVAASPATTQKRLLRFMSPLQEIEFGVHRELILGSAGMRFRRTGNQLGMTI